MGDAGGSGGGKEAGLGGEGHKDFALTPGTRTTYFPLPQTTCAPGVPEATARLGFVLGGQQAESVGLLNPRLPSGAASVPGMPAVLEAGRCSLLGLGPSCGPESGAGLLGGLGGPVC